MPAGVIGAIGTITSAINAGKGFANAAGLNDLEDERKAKAAAEMNWGYQQKGMDYGYKLNEQAAIAAQKRAEEWYNTYSSPQAMVKQYEAAGLNPALMNNAGGTGGTAQSGGTGGAGTGGTLPDSISQMAMGVQGKMQRAQIGLIEAQTFSELARGGMTRTEAERKAFDLQLDKDTRESTVKLRQNQADIAGYDAETKKDEMEMKQIDKVIKQYLEGYRIDKDGYLIHNIEESITVRRAKAQTAIDEATQKIKENDMNIDAKTKQRLTELMVSLTEGKVKLQDFEIETLELLKGITGESGLSKGLLKVLEIILVKALK